MNNKRVLLGMSGGVDSSVAAILLKEQGYEVVGVTMKLLSNEFSDEDAKKVCKSLDIEHYTVDYTEEFRNKVIKDFCSCYANCKTPNPCIECNKYLKFGLMQEKAKELNCDYIATGHYAKTKFSSEYNRYVLKKANSLSKDQSYVLWNMPKDLVSKVLFPLSEYTDKNDIREIALKYNLPVANKKDSQDICFIPDGDYKKFLEENSNIKPIEGNIVNAKGEVLGKHKGLYYYTIGQRKGLGISNPTPLFVLGFNKLKNEVIVGEERELYKKELIVEDVNLVLFDDIKEPLNVMTKTRYSAKEFSSTIYPIEDGKIKVVFDEPQRAITPGQSAVFYIDDIVVRRRKNNIMKENVPEFLYQLLLKEYDKDITNKIVEGFLSNRNTTFRVNTLKVSVDYIKQKLNEFKIEFKQVSWNENAFIIEDIKENEIRELDIYKNGEIYLQSLSSMISPIIVNPKEGENILDMAAAPGGKTTQMANLSNNKAMITACEKNKIRAERLKYNLEKQGASRVSVMLKDARKLDDFFSFDKILLDAPCSGSGTINLNDINLEKTFTKELIDRSIKTQKELIRKAVKILKVNGELVYSTCSVLKEENEKVVEEILKMGNIEIVPINEKEFKDIPLLPVSVKGTMCVCPTKLYEGFFVAKLKKIR